MKPEPAYLLLCVLVTVTAARAQSVDHDKSLYGVAQDPNGRPVTGAKLAVFPDLELIATNEFWRQAAKPSTPMYRSVTGSDGRFAIAAEPGRVYRVRITKPGFRTFELRAVVGRPFLAQMTPGRDETKAIAASDATTGPTVSGTITNAEGKPVTGAVLRKPWDWDTLARTGPDGAYSVAFGKDDEFFMVFHPGFQVGVIHRPSSENATAKPQDLELAHGYAVTGRLLDEAGKPIAGTRVVIDSDILVAENHSYSGVPWSTTTDASGRFAFAELAPNGRYFVRTILNDGTPLEFGQGWAKQAACDLGTYRTGPRTSVAGVAKWKDGRPIEFGFVHVLRLYDGPLSQWFVARETPAYPLVKGQYRIPGLCPGRYELCFMVENAEPEVRLVTAPAKGGKARIDVAIGVGRSFQGKVVDLDGKPIAGALLRGLQFGGNDAAPLVPPNKPDHNGRFLVGNVRVLTRKDGTYLLERVRSYVPTRLVVIKQGFKTRTIRVDVGDEPPAEIVLERAQ